MGVKEKARVRASNGWSAAALARTAGGIMGGSPGAIIGALAGRIVGEWFDPEG
jgi:hypothetical protein